MKSALTLLMIVSVLSAFSPKPVHHTGYMHLYLYSIRRGFLAQVTKGDWEVTDVAGTDGKRVWYLSTETSPPTSAEPVSSKLNNELLKSQTSDQDVTSKPWLT